MVQIGFKTDPGKMRSINEDALFVMPKQNVYIIADGVGGHNAGELASRTAVSEIAAYIAEHPIEKSRDDLYIKDYFSNCFATVNTSVYNASHNNPAHRGMATTAVLLYITGKKAYVVNVGDSRAYLIRNEMLSQITEDHTIVSQMLKEGSITKQEAMAHPMNNMITRALGGEKVVKPDFYQIEINKKDIFLLCSDGLYSEVREEQIVEILRKETSMHSACAEMILMANSNEGKDNITVVCIRV